MQPAELKGEPDGGSTPRNGLRKCVVNTTFSDLTGDAGTEISENPWFESSSSSDEERNAHLKNGGIPRGWLCSYYKKFDQYWNVFPKTDYTYLPSSPYNGKCVAPGIPVIPNMSRRSINNNHNSTPSPPGFSRTTADHRYTSSAPSSLSSFTISRRGNYFRSRFGSSSSEETLQKIHNSQKQSGWQRVRDVWTSIWWFITTTVVTVIETCTTVITAAGRTTASAILPTTRPLTSSTLLRFYLLPLLSIFLIYFFRSPLLDALYTNRIANVGGWSGLVVKSDWLLSPLYSICDTANSALFLVTRSVIMIPTLAQQAVSILWSFLVFWPSHVLGLFMNNTMVDRSTVATDNYIDDITKLKTGENIGVNEIRKVVIDILREQEKEKSKMQDDINRDTLLSELEEKVNLSYLKLIDRLKEMAERLRDEEKAKAEGLESMLRQQIEEAKLNMMDAETLNNAIRPMIETWVKKSINGLKSSVVETLKEEDRNERENIEEILPRILENSSLPDNWRREVEWSVKEKWKAVLKEEMKKQLEQETNAKLKEQITVMFNMWSDKSRQEFFNSLEQQQGEWKTLVESLEARLAEVEKGDKKDEMAIHLTDPRSSILQEIQSRIHQLEQAVFTNGVTSESSNNLGKSSEVTEGSKNLVWENIEHFVMKCMKTVIAKYHADVVSMPDYALQSGGGSIVSIRCTKTYPNAGRYYLFNFPLWGVYINPDTILKPGIMPGECWAFEGSEGYVVIKLAARIIVKSFTMEHVPKELSLYGHIKSAPNDFSVWGLEDENDQNPVLLGNFRFLDNGESLQQFKAKEYDTDKGGGGFDMIELKIESNHGNLDYTCLYRFRVHGIPVYGLT